jgi:hypothetical protein
MRHMPTRVHAHSCCQQAGLTTAQTPRHHLHQLRVDDLLHIEVPLLQWLQARQHGTALGGAWLCRRAAAVAAILAAGPGALAAARGLGRCFGTSLAASSFCCYCCLCCLLRLGGGWGPRGLASGPGGSSCACMRWHAAVGVGKGRGVWEGWWGSRSGHASATHMHQEAASALMMPHGLRGTVVLMVIHNPINSQHALQHTRR